jgi:hypothetical protein
VVTAESLAIRVSSRLRRNLCVTAPNPGFEINQAVAAQDRLTMRGRLWLNLSLIWVAILLIAIPLILVL